MLLTLLVSLLVGASTVDLFKVSLLANTYTINFFSSALSVTGTRKQLRPIKRDPSPSTFLCKTGETRTKTKNIKLAAKPLTISPTIEWIPTRIEFEGVYRSYGPPTLWRKLTSSVPRREFALQDITLAFGKADPDIISNDDKVNEGSLCLLLGASSSGKSTIFRSLLEAAREARKEIGEEEFDRAENKGRLTIRQLILPGKFQAYSKATAKPVLLDDRGEVNTLSSGKPKTTLREAWNDSAIKILKTTDEESKILVISLLDFLAHTIFELDPEALLVDLTPSEKYRFCLGKACIESSFSATCRDSNVLPGPILLLDEWMDVETSDVVRKVQPSLHKIVEELNGIVLSITHKPELYSVDTSVQDASNLRRITLSAGRLLSDY